MHNRSNCILASLEKFGDFFRIFFPAVRNKRMSGTSKCAPLAARSNRLCSLRLNDGELPDIIRSLVVERSFLRKDEKPADIWSMVPNILQYLSSSTVSIRSVSKLAWSLDKLGMYEEQCWSKFILLMIHSAASSPSDISIFLFSLANAFQREPSLISREELDNIWTVCVSGLPLDPRLSLCDSVQLFYASSVLYESRLSVKFGVHSMDLLSKVPYETHTSCRDICLMWSSVCKTGNMKDLEPLLEASRGLRYCRDFNQNKAAQIAESCMFLRIYDPRVISQIINFVNVNHKTINGRNLLRIAQSFSKIGISNEIFWKRIAQRLQDPIGMKFSVEQIETFKSLLDGRLKSQRVFGILELFQKTKIDAKKFGPA